MNLVIPDVHNKTKLVDLILSKYDEKDLEGIYFLGDIFDDFYDNYNDAWLVAKWLKQMLWLPKMNFIWGNHDLAYAYHSPLTECSGWTRSKQEAINDWLKERDWDRFQFYYFVNGYLLTHAGLTKPFLGQYPNAEALLRNESPRAIKALKQGRDHWFYQAGFESGGSDPFGGIVWCRPNEFIPIEGLNQIYGHTPDKLKIIKGENSTNYQIDTNLYQYMEIHDDGNLVMKDTPPLIP